MAENITRLAALGVEVWITEMDVRIRRPVTPEKLASQAAIYRDVLRAALPVPGFKAFVTWGFTDRYSWRPDAFPGYEAS